MGKNIVILAVIVTAAYLVGVESAKSRGKNYEDLRHQIERLWTSPDAKKARRRMRNNLRKSMGKARKNVLGSTASRSDTAGWRETRPRCARAEPEMKEGNNIMGAGDKIKAAADKVAGQVKETVGKATDNDKLVAEGKADQAKGTVKDTVEDVKDAFKK